MNGKTPVPGVLRKAVFFIHLWLGLLLGLYAVLVGITGSVLMFQAEIDRALNPRLHHVRPAGKRVPLEAALETVRRAYPGLEISGVWISPDPAAPYEFRGGKVEYTDWSVARRGVKQIYVHPYTGEILGSRPRFGEVFNFIFYLHRDLLLGINGSMLLRWAAIPFAVLLLSGLWLWWPTLRNFGKQLRIRLAVQRDASYRRLLHDLHNVAGIYPLAILLLPVTTAAIWGFWEPAERLVYRLTGTPYGQAAPEPPAPRHAARPIPLEQALGIARSAYPAAEVLNVTPTRGKQHLQVRMAFPDTAHFPPAHVTLHLDPADGRVVHVEDERERSRGATAMAWVHPLHIGTWGTHFGPALDVMVRALYLLAGLAPLALFVTGVLKYVEKRKARQKNRLRHEHPPRHSTPVLPSPVELPEGFPAEAGVHAR